MFSDCFYEFIICHNSRIVERFEKVGGREKRDFLASLKVFWKTTIFFNIRENFVLDFEFSLNSWGVFPNFIQFCQFIVAPKNFITYFSNLCKISFLPKLPKKIQISSKKLFEKFLFLFFWIFLPAFHIIKNIKLQSAESIYCSNFSFHDSSFFVLFVSSPGDYFHFFSFLMNNSRFVLLKSREGKEKKEHLRSVFMCCSAILLRFISHTTF